MSCFKYKSEIPVIWAVYAAPNHFLNPKIGMKKFNPCEALLITKVVVSGCSNDKKLLSTCYQ